MEKEYYRAYYRLERSHWWFKARAEILKSQIQKIYPHRTDLKILNVGCATGHSSEWLMPFGSVESLEYDADCFAFTRDVVKIPIVQGSILNLPFESHQFDLVVAFDVVEHVENDVLAIEEMQRVAKSGGFVFISVPAYMFLWSKHDAINHHFRRYTQATLSKAFKKSILQPVYTSYFNTLLFIPVAAFRFVGNLATAFKTRKNTAYDENSSDLNVGASPFVNNLLFQIFKLEDILLKRRFHLPFGVSIMAIYKK